MNLLHVDGTIARDISKFIRQAETISKVYPMKASNVVNYDETRVYARDEDLIRLEHTSKERAQRRGIKGRTIGSLVSFVAADGSVLMSVWIFKATAAKDDENDDMMDAKFIIDEPPKNLRGTWKRYYTYTKSGYSNKVLHAQIMEKFASIWAEQSESEFCWLFGDQLAAHKSPDTVEKALKNNVMCWLLPANTSHFLQPLDDTIFAWFKQELKMVGKKLGFSHSITPDEITLALYNAGYKAERIAFTPCVIQKAFANTGLWPFNPDRIMELTKKCWDGGERDQGASYSYNEAICGAYA